MKKIFFIMLIFTSNACATMIDINTYIPYDTTNRMIDNASLNTREGYFQYGGGAGRLFTPEASNETLEHMIFDDSGSYATVFGKALNANVDFIVPTEDPEGEPLIGQRETSFDEQVKQLQRMEPKTRNPHINTGY